MMQGDLVVRKSYGGDVLFRVATIDQQSAILKGTDYRLLADAPIVDLSVVKDGDLPVAIRQARLRAGESTQRMQEERQQQIIQRELLRVQNQTQPYFEVPGRVLHLDGDSNYMKKSMQLYTQMRVPAHGLFVHESQMADAVYRLLPQIKPDIIVITGHDGVLKNREQNDLSNLASYKNSQNFVDAVRIAREYEKNRDSLIIVAGACQSHYEALLQSGSNFASSPGRVLIHALDPVYIAIKASYTPIRETINLTDVIHGTISGIDGVGGIETLGKHRVGLPKPRTLTGVKATV
ncbi:sporulation peptidase YabG [Paenibacillus sacheonensis]|uniref:Sporulation peptidase YabG n=1 Tax=Paenibacillus sacheonensis TaxID=742054 RepID=A0A7X5C225_9BACL|nr:sporulation peptidase YabG [Paenibacillus sacheonensis]MBM7569345.1 spore coat assembly protein [Paenibacillus sacheonensis]NBC73336.1 sporulation peptidase YabG [Paenibacillus sacheonensis]